MEESVKNVFQASQESFSDIGTNLNIAQKISGLQKDSEESDNTVSSKGLIPALITAKPVITQSYKSIDMSLLELRASLNTAETPEQKSTIIDEFIKNHNHQDFYSLSLTKKGMSVDIESIDQYFKPLLSEMLTADICDIGKKDCIVACVFFGNWSKIENIPHDLISIKKINLKDLASQEKILGALQHVMRTPRVTIR